MEVIFLIIGLITGGITTFFITKHHNESSKKDLKNEVAKLRELTIRILWSMEEAGLIQWNRDSKGNIIGLDIRWKSESMAAKRKTENRTLH